MSYAALDQAILDSVGVSWSKVAMVIARASMSPEWKHHEGHDAIAVRIEALIADGRLEVMGDVKNWRYSEVRVST